MSLKNLFENVLNEDYKADYNNYIDLGRKTKRQSSYVRDKAKNTSISTASGPIKFTYKSEDAFNDWVNTSWRDTQSIKNNGILSIYINDQLAWSSDKQSSESFIDRKFFANPKLSLADILGQNYSREPKDQQAFSTLLNAMTSTGLSLSELESHWNNVYTQALSQFNKIKSRNSNITTAIDNRDWSNTKKYMSYIGDIHNLDNLKVGDKVHYLAKYGKEGEKDWQDGTILKISDDRSVFTIKSDYGWTNTIKNTGDNIALDKVKKSYIKGLDDEDDILYNKKYEN